MSLTVSLWWVSHLQRWHSQPVPFKLFLFYFAPKRAFLNEVKQVIVWLPSDLHQDSHNGRLADNLSSMRHSSSVFCPNYFKNDNTLVSCNNSSSIVDVGHVINLIILRLHDLTFHHTQSTQ